MIDVNEIYATLDEYDEKVIDNIDLVTELLPHEKENESMRLIRNRIEDRLKKGENILRTILQKLEDLKVVMNNTEELKETILLLRRYHEENSKKGKEV